jgi:hypothetical protein
MGVRHGVSGLYDARQARQGAGLFRVPSGVHGPDERFVALEGGGNPHPAGRGNLPAVLGVPNELDQVPVQPYKNTNNH